MEPKGPAPGAGPSPEAGPITPIEVSPDASEAGQVEAAPAPAAPEVDRPAGESANQNQGMVLPAPAPQPVAPAAPAKTDDDGDDAAKQMAAIDSPDLADDVDVIEKEWVDKAKQIVHDSVDDPYRQNHNVSVLKADYMKKRYGKDIKIPDDKPAEA